MLVVAEGIVYQNICLYYGNQQFLSFSDYGNNTSYFNPYEYNKSE